MKPFSCNLIRSTAAVCVLMVSGLIHAEDGVVRISDTSSGYSKDSGVVRISDHRKSAVRPVNHLTMPSSGPECCVPVGPVCEPGCAMPSGCVVEPECCAPLGCCPTEGCSTYGREYVCSSACCCGPQCCCGSGGYGHCGCNGSCFGQSHQAHMNKLFAGPVCSGTGCPANDCWRGQAMSFREKNSRLADKLFGWMVPSGCCGQGCPPVGKYQITYADQPEYADPRDSRIYAAQGYGMPMTVPLAPNVYQQYNYSWGVPASRITPISTYNPMTSPQPLYHQTW